MPSGKNLLLLNYHYPLSIEAAISTQLYWNLGHLTEVGGP